MGAWGVGIFDNDDACDWVNELEQSSDLSVILKTLIEVAESSTEQYLESPEASYALAAAEVVASFKNSGGSILPKNVGMWIDNHKNLAVDPLRIIAARAVKRVKTDSELKELWEETPDIEEWYSLIMDLEARLT